MISVIALASHIIDHGIHVAADAGKIGSQVWREYIKRGPAGYTSWRSEGNGRRWYPPASGTFWRVPLCMIPERPLVPGCVAQERQREMLSNVCNRLSSTRRIEQGRISLSPGDLLLANCDRRGANSAQVGHAGIQSFDLKLTGSISSVLIEH